MNARMVQKCFVCLSEVEAVLLFHPLIHASHSSILLFFSSFIFLCATAEVSRSSDAYLALLDRCLEETRLNADAQLQQQQQQQLQEGSAEEELACLLPQVMSIMVLAGIYLVSDSQVWVQRRRRLDQKEEEEGRGWIEELFCLFAWG